MLRSVDEIRRYSGFVDEIGEVNLDHVSDVLFRLRLATEHIPNIRVFRLKDDVDLIATLAEFASARDRHVRINASLVLANVVDNSTICAVINKLFAPDLNDDARVNLLQILDIVAPRALTENREWAKKMVEHTRGRIFGQQDYGMTMSLLDSISRNLSIAEMKFTKGTLAQEHADDFSKCRELPNLETLL